MIGIFLIASCDFFIFLIIITWEVPVEYKLITCLSKALHFFFNFVIYFMLLLFSIYFWGLFHLLYQLFDVSIIVYCKLLLLFFAKYNHYFFTILLHTILWCIKDICKELMVVISFFYSWHDLYYISKIT